MYNIASIKCQDALIQEVLSNPGTDIVNQINISGYFIMGK